MREPKRKSEDLRRLKQTEPDYFLTAAAIARMKKTLIDLREQQRPEAISEVQRTQEMGDLSENAAYQEAKWRLRRINDKILLLTEQLHRAVLIAPTDAKKVHLGSVVEIEHQKKRFVYEIVGSTETDPVHGRVSCHSPLGRALLGHAVGDNVEVVINDHLANYTIISLTKK